jgi:hypothetical protein
VRSRDHTSPSPETCNGPESSDHARPSIDIHTHILTEETMSLLARIAARGADLKDMREIPRP